MTIKFTYKYTDKNLPVMYDGIHEGKLVTQKSKLHIVCVISFVFNCALFCGLGIS